jgi:hypothetical protein
MKAKKMPDITMCKGEGCIQREGCYRFTAKPSEYRQSYFIDVPFTLTRKGMQRCTEIMPLWKKEHD